MAMPGLVAKRHVKTLNERLAETDADGHRSARRQTTRIAPEGAAPSTARGGPLAAVAAAALALLLCAASALAATPASPTARPSSAADGAATRVAIPGLGIDLPVVSSEVTLEGNEPGYPLCDVAQYSEQFEDPGQPGTTYIYAHARPGMFLPLLEASRVDEGRSLLGLDALVYTNDARLHTYRIFLVKRHATDFSLADEVPPGERRLILQTSEGPLGTIPVLQVAATLVSTVAADLEDAHPVAHPGVCQDPVPPLVPKRFLAAAGVGVVALLAVIWWLRKRKRFKGRHLLPS